VETLSADSLFRLYSETEWADVVGAAPIPKLYNGFSTVSLVKAHLLVYLLPLASERALARELGERAVLQDLCGFKELGQDGHRLTPTRATLWHFRRRFSHDFAGLILRGLVALELAAMDERKALDIVKSPPSPGLPVKRQRFSLPRSGISGDFVFYDEGCNDKAQDQVSLFAELDRVGTGSPNAGVSKELLGDALGFPIEVQIEHPDSRRHSFVLVRPTWLYTETRLKDLGLGPDFGEKRPYTACNVIVTREWPQATEILLAQRLSGSGRGTFALPGGKKRPEETVLDCAERELFEETGLHLVRDCVRPVSIDYTNLPGFPRVKSVGVHAPVWGGNLRRKEPLIHSTWQWFSPSDLPEPIFEPSRLVLDAFLQARVVDISWEEVEEPLPLWKRDIDF
jgi:8-oxo-dGTP pyrophosphatase MutT (NUDIX family)